jgi:hypothetical protein
MTADSSARSGGAGVWEPWTFAPGNHVEVRISTECPRTGAGHWLEESGATGYVMAATPSDDRHPYWVSYDSPVAVPECLDGMRWGFYAGIELSPLTQAAATDEGSR